MTLARGRLHNTVFPIPDGKWLHIDFKQLIFTLPTNSTYAVK